MKLVNTDEMRILDRKAMEEGAVPGILLMENAGKAVADASVAQMKGAAFAKAVVLCGKGNNGGDGFAAARWLYNRGWQVRVLLVDADFAEVQGDAALELQMLRQAGVEIHLVQSEDELNLAEIACVRADILIDALLGTGFHGALQGNLKNICHIINSAKKQVVAVDVPTGVDADTGAVDEDAVAADVTITMALAKIGLLLYPAKKYVGQLMVADIGMPAKLLNSCQSQKYRLTAAIVRRLLPVRDEDAHKGDAGKVALVAGCPGYVGAAALAATGALRAGAGLVSLLTPLSSRDTLAVKLTEAMVHGLMERMPGVLGGGAVQEILGFVKKADVLAIGPGLGTSAATMEIVRDVLGQLDKPVIMDADALTALQGHTELLQEMQVPKVITPHVGEMAGLTGLSIEEVKTDRVGIAKKYAMAWQTIIVMKGAPTVIACPDGEVYLNTTGCNAMATGGCGDVLTGIIAALAGQEITLREAVLCAVYLHGLAGELATERTVGMLAGDLAASLPAARRFLETYVDEKESVLNFGIKSCLK